MVDAAMQARGVAVAICTCTPAPLATGLDRSVRVQQRILVGVCIWLQNQSNGLINNHCKSHVQVQGPNRLASSGASSACFARRLAKLTCTGTVTGSCWQAVLLNARACTSTSHSVSLPLCCCRDNYWPIRCCGSSLCTSWQKRQSSTPWLENRWGPPHILTLLIEQSQDMR